ncbi:restriction endonuclease subunit S [uncultured Streptococcus sp.]|uniref:restriction endonuclease subunit S n=1 Tax=uncultured Streptococcus sp. TaxID=83427 RepID=UPI0028D6EFFB|nr:restriction endonuclease subunit S [uncultured Streptococcus sp.]
MNKKPKVMFSNFKNNWKIFSFYNLANVFQSGGTPSTKEPTFWSGTIPWIQSSDIQKDILFGVKPQKFISEEGLQNSSAKLISKNSIAIVTRVGVGKLAIIDQDYATSQDFLSLSDFNGDTQFIVYSIYRMLQKESTQLQGTSIKGITKEDLLSKKVSLPEIDEQSAIGSLFRTLDDLLASYKDNLANYQSLKATMLSKMFPKAGQTVPEIRLDGFEGEWEVVSLGTLIENYDEIISGASGFPIATSSRKGLYLQNDYFEGGRTGIDLTLDFHRVPMGYVTYRHMSDDSIFKFNKNNFETDVLVSKEYPVFISNDSSDIDFLLYHLNNSRLFLRFSTMQKLGGTRVRLYYKNLITYKLAVPTLKEQQAIGAYFSNLDNLIAAHQEKISQLETLKKKLLQDMFI